MLLGDWNYSTLHIGGRVRKTKVSKRAQRNLALMIDYRLISQPHREARRWEKERNDEVSFRYIYESFISLNTCSKQLI